MKYMIFAVLGARLLVADQTPVGYVVEQGDHPNYDAQLPIPYLVNGFDWASIASQNHEQNAYIPAFTNFQDGRELVGLFDPYNPGVVPIWTPYAPQVNEDDCRYCADNTPTPIYTPPTTTITPIYVPPPVPINTPVNVIPNEPVLGPFPQVDPIGPIAPVPEPSTWMLMLCCLSLVGVFRKKLALGNG